MNNPVKLNRPAPDFYLRDFNGNDFTLSEFNKNKNVVLVFNRGFTWPFCRRHMAQLRRDYSKFLSFDTEVVVIGPEGTEQFKEYWRQNSIPFTGLPDPNHKILKLYGQQVKIFKFGRMPAQVIIDKLGIIRYVHYGLSMSDIPDNKDLLSLIDNINAELQPSAA